VSSPPRRAAIALGANLGPRAATLEAAIRELDREVGRVRARSRTIETEPLVPPGDDPTAHPPYLNAVVLVDTALAPLDLLDRLLAIERRHGRDRRRETRRWQPRTLDLDLLLIEDRILDHPRLILPHPRLHERRFVLEPLLEVWPDWRHPRLGLTVRELWARLGSP